MMKSTIRLLFCLVIMRTGWTASNQEIIVYDLNDFANDQVNCESNKDCIVKCCGTSSCAGATINCPSNRNCDVICEGLLSCSPNMVINYPTGGSSSLSCTGPKSCFGLEFPTPTANIPFSIDCDQRDACKEATINCPTNANCNILCHTWQACYNANITCPTNGNCNILCHGGDACRDSTITGPINGDFVQECFGDGACESGTLACPSASICDISCEQTEACAHYDVTWPTAILGEISYPRFDGYRTFTRFTFPIPDPNVPVLIECWDYNMCEEATINCPANADCTIQCGYESCTDATINCPTATGTGCAVLCEAKNACKDTVINWNNNNNCHSLVCKNEGGFRVDECPGATPVPSSQPACTLPLSQP